MKYNGKQARISAIKKSSGITLDEGMSLSQIKAFAAENIYGTYKWGTYLKELRRITAIKNELRKNVTRGIREADKAGKVASELRS